MRFLSAMLRHTGRNMCATWKSQIMTLFTVALSVLIFSFFFLIYINALQAGAALDDDLRLIAYLDEYPTVPMQESYRDKILRFDKVERIEFVDSAHAFKRLEQQLGDDRDILTGMPTDFLPPSIEIYPVRSLDGLGKIKRFSDYLQTLPGVVKVQYGKEWIERFYAFVRLMQMVVLLSGALLIMTTTFMVAHTIHLTLLRRRHELELLRLVGATNSYISTPFLLEGAMQGLIGSLIGMATLLSLFNWIKLQFTGPVGSELLSFTFFPTSIQLLILGAATLLCTAGSFSAIRRFLRL
ncbi:MAG: cell division protein FtsX [Desulfobulbus sp.]